MNETHRNKPRTLTVSSRQGLANRLRLLISGLVIAEESGREFTLYWNPSRECGCAFPELFQNTWNIKSELAPANQPFVNWGSRKWQDLPDLLASTEPHLSIQYFGWLLQPALYPYHTQYLPRCVELFSQLEPIPAIQGRVREFHDRFFRTPMIGVHLRRGDLGWAHPDVMNNTPTAIYAVEQFLERSPDAQIFLCTDDGAINPFSRALTHRENVHKKFVERFGPRVILPQPRSLDRNACDAIQDALMELWLLRQTDFFVGTAISSFSELAVFGRNVPSVMTHQPRPLYARVEHFLRWMRLQPALEQFSLRRFGHKFPATSLLFFYYRYWLVRQIKRLGRGKIIHDRNR